MATRGALGGLASATSDAALLLDAAGREVILIETVGVGQDEIDIARLADVVVLLLVPGMGDDVQTIKAGIMEIADVFVINKSDRPGADRLEQEVRAMLSIAPRADGWQPPIVRTVATEGRGAEQVRAAVERYASFTREGGLGERKRIERWRDRLLALLRDRLLERVLATSLSDASFEAYARRIATREVDPYSVVDEVLRKAGL
jgi:LAO/AO transport system kinase